MKKVPQTPKKDESTACHISVSAQFAFWLLIALLNFGSATLIYAQDQQVTARGQTNGTVTERTDDSLTIAVKGSSTLVRFEAPPAPNSSPLDPVPDPRVANLLRQLAVGDQAIIDWESRQGRRIPIGIDRLSDMAKADAVARPVTADESLVPRQMLTDRGGRFDVSMPLDPRLTGTETIVYDRIFNGVTGHRDIYRMYIDGRLPICLTCFIVPRIRAVMGNPTIDPSNQTVVVQRLNDNAEGDGRLIEGLGWGINHDLWALTIESREFRPIWQSPPGHGAAHPQFLNGTQVRFAEHALPPESTDRGAELLAFSMNRQQQDPWFNWREGRASARASQPQIGQSRDLRDQPRLITYGDRSVVTAIASEAGFQRLYNAPSAVRQRVIDHSLIERERRSEFGPGDQLGPALWDTGRNLLVYSASRAIPINQLGTEGWQTPTDLFVRIADGTLYQLTDHATRSRQSGDAYQIIDLDWTEDRKTLIVGIQALNPITRREREAEIWRFDLSQLLATKPQPDAN